MFSFSWDLFFENYLSVRRRIGNDVTKAGILGALIVARTADAGAGTKLQVQLPNSASVARSGVP
jgi:hypothetical protein